MSFENAHLRFEKILERALDRGLKSVEVNGTDSGLAIALFLTQATASEFWQRSQLIVVPNAKAATELENHFRFFDRDATVSVLSSFDVSPFSGLYPNARQIAERVAWAHAAHNPGLKHFFIAPVEALLQRTIPPDVLKAHTLRFKRGAELPTELARELSRLGYQSVPLVEDVGTFAVRGGIVDIFSPAHAQPVRIELFGDNIESLRFFSPETQRSDQVIDDFTVIPPREILYGDDSRMRAATKFKASVEGRKVDETDRDSIQQSIVQGQLFPGLDFLVGDFYEKFALPIDHFSPRQGLNLWLQNPIEIEREADIFLETLGNEYKQSDELVIRPPVDTLFVSYDKLPRDRVDTTIALSNIEFQDQPFDEAKDADKIAIGVMDLRFPQGGAGVDALKAMLDRVHAWREGGFSVLIAAGTQAQSQRLIAFFEKSHFKSRLVSEDDFDLGTWIEEQRLDATLVHIVPRNSSESLRFSDEQLIFLRDEDFFGKKQQRRREHKATGTLEDRVNALSFQDLKPGDAIVHVLHGIGIYEGLKVMPIAGIESEYITLSYKDGDKLYLPVYRIGQIQKFSGPRNEHLIDKLGGTKWQNTKIKVRNHLRELAVELLQLYAKRSQAHRPPSP